MAYKKVEHHCPNCGKKFQGHPNARFCKTKCKDQYHNRHNPRGYGARRQDEDDEEDADG